MLVGTDGVVDAVHAKGESVLIHCSDGWDRTAQLTALSQLMLDPYYRTFDGFKALIRKEWAAFGHKFEDRFGRTLSKEKEASPIFVQFLDCVWQLMRVYPTAFAFGPDYLVGLYGAVVCGRYGTFLGNSERARIRDHLCGNFEIYGTILFSFFFPSSFSLILTLCATPHVPGDVFC